jgi:hypothetical protein
MRRVYVAALTVIGLASILAAPPALGQTLQWARELELDECPAGSLIISVRHRVTNDIDSGTTRPAWAWSDYARKIRILQLTDPTKFCAVVEYHGSFETIAGDSPQAATTSGSVGDGIVGTFEGGYRTVVFTGTLKAGAKTKGDLGLFDYGCDAQTGNCSSVFSWRDYFFSSYSSSDLDWWGWIYTTAHNGRWINACTGPSATCPGNSGDITGN